MNTNTDENIKAMSETNASTVQEMVGEWGIYLLNSYLTSNVQGFPFVES